MSNILQTTVTTGQTSADIPVLTVANLRELYGFSIPTTKETYFSNMILVAQKACASYMGLETLKQLVTCTEYIDVNRGQREVILSGQPLVAVNHVYDGTSTRTDFIVDYRTNVVKLTDGAKYDQVKVEYQIGWGSTLPEDMLWCVAMTVQSMSRMANASLMGKNSMNTDGGSETYEQSVVPLAVRTYLDKYRLMRVC